MTALESGSTLGKYQLLVRIGHGGMASVWVARERSPQSGRQRLVAVKAMLPALARQAAFRAMFLEEVQLVQSIQHENVVQVYDVSEDAGILYMAMEWVEGESLRNVIRAASGRRPIPAEIAVQVIADAAAGLHAAHELRGWDGELRGVVHCDVSPHNILLGVDGRAKLVDFGVAGALERADGQGVRGKLGYMAPEQARAEPVDRRTDVYALGIVLFELTTGTHLFATGNRDETLKLVADPVIPLPTDLTPGYPPQLETIVLQSLERNPSRRFRTAEEFRAALRQYLVDERVVVSRAGVAQLMRKVVGRPVKRRREQIAAVLRQMDGQVPEELVAQWPGLASPGYWSLHSDEPGGPSSTLVTLTDVDATQNPTFSTSGGSAVSTASRGPSWGAILALVVGVALVALAVGYLFSERVREPKGPAIEAQATSTTPRKGKEPGQRPPETETRHSRATPTSEGVSIDDLPLEEQKRVARSWRGSRSARARGTSKGKKAGKDLKGAMDVELEESSGPFDRQQAQAGLSRAAARTAACSASGGPKGGGSASVTFGPGGNVVGVQLPSQFNGTSVGNCVTSQFTRVRVPAFDGGAVTLSQVFAVP